MNCGGVAGETFVQRSKTVHNDVVFCKYFIINQNGTNHHHLFQNPSEQKSVINLQEREI